MAPVKSMTGRLKSQRGAELIEFALIFPLLLLVVLGIIDFGFLFQRYEVLTNATREGARMAVLPGYTTPDVKSRVCSYLVGGGIPTTGCPGTNPSNPSVTVTNDTIAMPSGLPALQVKRVQLTYSHNFMFIGPIIGLMGGTWSNSKAITTVAMMRKEVSTP
ncbi:MAG: pilus assembly protein [Acidobacteria bacterium]|nr:pilus assembly protein [Acidobacteriota bacterium]